MRILIIEDEILLAKKLQKLITSCEPQAMVEGIVQGVAEATRWLQEHTEPDLIFMDIELNDGQSFDIFSKTEVRAPVIFTTAYDEYAIRAFKVNSVDYLLKPIKQDDLQQALLKYKQHFSQHNASAGLEEVMKAIRDIRQPQSTPRDRFLVKTGQKMIPVEIKDIAFMFSENGISFIRTTSNAKYPLDHTLDELEQMVPDAQFMRANRQYILSKQSVRAIHQWFNGKLKVDVTPEPGEDVVISREKAGAFRQWLGG